MIDGGGLIHLHTNDRIGVTSIIRGSFQQTSLSTVFMIRLPCNLNAQAVVLARVPYRAHQHANY